LETDGKKRRVGCSRVEFHAAQTHLDKWDPTERVPTVYLMHGKAVAGLKMLIGAAIGKTLDDSIEGTLGF
jgi:hypothetical protein